MNTLTSGGRLIGSEFEPSKVLRARGNLATAGLHDFVENREADALESVVRDLPPSIELRVAGRRQASLPRGPNVVRAAPADGTWGVDHGLRNGHDMTLPTGPFMIFHSAGIRSVSIAW